MASQQKSKSDLNLLSESGDPVSSDWAGKVYNSFFNYKDDMALQAFTDLDNDGTQAGANEANSGCTVVFNLLTAGSALRIEGSTSLKVIKFIANYDNTNTLLVYPASGDSFFNLGADVPITIPSASAVIIVSGNAGDWMIIGL